MLLTTSAGAIKLTTIAASGESAPGTEPGVTFAWVFFPTINSLGEVAFYGTLQGPGIVASSNDSGVWLSTPNGLSLVARTGDPAPGTPTGVVFANVSAPVFNAANLMLFLGQLTGPGVTGQNSYGYWVADKNGPPQLLYRQGDPVANAGAGVTLSGIPFLDGQSGWSNAGLAFPGQLSGPTVTTSNENAVLGVIPGGGLSVIARQGDQAPGTPSGVLFTGFDIPIQIADSGEVLLNCAVYGPGVNTNNGGLWRTDPTGSLSPVVLLGNHAPFPGSDPRVFFSTIGRRGFAPDGSVFFMAGADAPLYVGVNREPSLWYAAPDGTISLLLAGNTQAPGFSSGALLQQIQPAVAGPGTYVFSSTQYSLGGGIGPNNNISYWLLRWGELTLLAQEGGAVSNIPGMPTFGFMQNDAPFPWTNSNGDLTVHAYLSGPGFTSADSDVKLFAWSDIGVVSAIQSGEQIEVAPGDNRVVQYINNGFSPIQSPLNDSRELVVPVQFQDGSSAIIVATIPKPPACGLLGIEVAAVLLPLAIWKRRGGRRPPRSRTRGRLLSDSGWRSREERAA
jgi:hypothetical protein